MKRRTSRHVACKRDNPHCLLYVVISPETEILCRPSLILFDNLIIFGRDEEEDQKHVACKRDNSHFICYVLISPESEIVLIFVHSITLIPLDIFW